MKIFLINDVSDMQSLTTWFGTFNNLLAMQPLEGHPIFSSPILSFCEKITRCFSDVMKCNQFRRINLEKEFFIECDCQRCNDGSELGTNYGGIIMQEQR